MSGQRLPEAHWVSELYDDIGYLAGQHALTGLAEIVRERRRQIEQDGFTPAHDRREHMGGTLLDLTRREAVSAFHGVFGGTDGPPECERRLARTGALAWAEIDRLAAEFGPQPDPDPGPEPAGYRCWTEGNYTHHAHKPGMPCPVYGGGD